MNERDIFLAARGRTELAARSAFLDEACAGDAALRQRVELLLCTDGRPDSLPDAPVIAHSDTDQTNTGAWTPPDSLLDAPVIAHSDTDQTNTGAWTPSGDAKGPPRQDSVEVLPFLDPPGRPGSLGRIGHFEVLEVLGRGGFGTVFRAFDEVLQREVAVKVLAPHMALTSSARKRFVREAQSSAAVRHKNVVRVYGVHEQPLPYLVMEFIPCETLQQRIDRLGPLEVPEVLRIGREIAEGLAAAHATGLIHRDVKPANVLLERGAHEHVKLTDFGLARAADDARLTQSGHVAGTPMYMSPEQAHGERLDPRSDLFSLGSVLYVMCTAKQPFRAKSPLAVLSRVCDDAPRPIREINAAVPDWLTALIDKLLAKDPAARFQTATEVADLLSQHLEHLQKPAPEAEDDKVTRWQGDKVTKTSDAALPPCHLVTLSPCHLVILGGIVALVAGALVLLMLRNHRPDDNIVGLPATTIGADELKERVADHQEAAAQMCRTNEQDEALNRLGQALADIDRAEATQTLRNTLRLGVYRQRAPMLRDLNRAEEAGEDGKHVRTLLEAIHADQPDDQETANDLGQLLLAEPAVRWTVLRPVFMRSPGGATLIQQDDGSILVSGRNMGGDVYTLALEGLPASVAALRLEVLAHPSLPNKGPGRHPSGNFHLGEITLYKTTAGADSGATGLPIAQAVADHAWPGMLIERAFDDDPLTPWHVWGQLGRNHWALFQLRQAVSFNEGDRLVVRLEFTPQEPSANLGCFRLSAGSHGQALETDPLQAALRAADPRGFAALGAGRFVHGDFAGAVGPLTRAVEARPGPAATLCLLLALAHQEVRESEKARKLYEQALKVLDQRLPDGMERLLVKRALMRIEGRSAAEAEARLTALEDDRQLAILTAQAEKGNKLFVHHARASWFACRGRWRESAKDLLAQIELNPKDFPALLAAAACLILGGDVDEHRKLCGRMAEQFRATTDPHEADIFIKICLLRAGSIDAANLPLKTLDKSLEEGRSGPVLLSWFAACRGLAAYRAGDFQQAERWAVRSVEKAQGSLSAPLALLVRALAEHQLGRQDKAQRSFAEASAMIPGELRMLGTNEYVGTLPVNAYAVYADLLIAEVLRREAEATLFPALPAYLKGERQPRDNAERLALAFVCRARNQRAAAARLYADAFAEDPALADDLKAGHRYAAACCAARAAVSINAAQLEEQEQGRWRRQALRWLQDDLTARTRQWETGSPQDRMAVRETMQEWQRNPEFARVRLPAAIALLPANEQEEWRKLWAEVRALAAKNEG
jgi:serine/threonine protein kinase/tetratricopeptide (TPR) repeat protein